MAGTIMLGRIIEIEGVGRRLSLHRGFLAIGGPDGALGQVPLDDIDALMVTNPATNLTGHLLAALAERGAAVVICGANFKPAAYLLPVDGHYAQGDRVEAQAAASLPTRKRLWADLVRAKILAQAALLARLGHNPIPVAALAGRVKSGDPDNCEAQAAQRYFPLAFGAGFTRSRDDLVANAFMNYGYTVLRTATARAIVAAGLHPSLSLAHRSRGEALRLADDLMEPFRPAVDLAALGLIQAGHAAMTPEAKRELVSVLHSDYLTTEGMAPLANVLGRLAMSLGQIFLGERKTLALPKSPIPVADIKTGAAAA
jgi:CRISPR-associated protein Cas1